jgi:hypothetical protein
LIHVQHPPCPIRPLFNERLGRTDIPSKIITVFDSSYPPSALSSTVGLTPPHSQPSLRRTRTCVDDLLKPQPPPSLPNSLRSLLLRFFDLATILLRLNPSLSS